jgi:hypothetical protein
VIGNYLGTCHRRVVRLVIQLHALPDTVPINSTHPIERVTGAERDPLARRLLDEPGDDRIAGVGRDLGEEA